MKEKTKEKTQAKAPEKYSLKKLWHDWIWPLLFAVIVVKLLINPFLIEQYEVPTGSMERTILPGDRLFAEKFSYGIHIPFTSAYILPMAKPRSGQIVVFKSPYDGLNLVKRCIAGAGDTVEVRHKKLFVNGKERPDLFARHSDPSEIPDQRTQIAADLFQRYWANRQLYAEYWIRDNFGPVVVPKDCLFMMGDNRDDSFDSRFWGPLPLHLVRGRALFVFWSWDKQGDQPWYLFWQRFRIKRVGKLLFKA